MDAEENDSPASGTIQIRDLVAIVRMQWRLVASVTAGAVVLAMLHGALVPRQYRSTAVLHLSSMAGQEMKVDRVVDTDQYNRWNRQMFVQTQLEILRSASMLNSVLEAYARDGGTDLPADPAGRAELLSMLEINPRQGTELLDLSITSTDPEKSAKLANLMAQIYAKKNLAAMTEAARDAGDWLDGQVRTYDEQIGRLTDALVAYQRDQNLTDVSDEVSALVDVSAQRLSLNTAYAEVTTDRVLLQTTVENHERLLRNGQFVELAKQLDTPLVASLTQEYATAVTEHAEIAARYLEKHPERMAAEAKLARIESELHKEVAATVSAERKELSLAQSKQESLEAALQSNQAALADTSSDRESYGKLKLELERAKEFFVKLTQRRDELKLQSQTQLNNVRIVDAAIAVPKPVFPNVPLNFAVALMGGFVGGLALGFAREFFDDRISSPLEVQTFLKTNFLGMIPKIPDVRDETQLAMYSHENPRSEVAESMRGIRTMLELDPVGQPRRLLVTSALQAEGKTSTVVRLGVAFANLGRRVIAIDADLRRPRIHKIFGAELDPGLSTVLRGASLDAAIRPTGVENFDYLAAGRGGDRPNELLASEAMRRLLDELSERYDLVIVDSPPTMLLSDARILSRHVDGVVMLVRDQTPRAVVREAIAGLERVRARVIGVAVNAVDLKKLRGGGRYYGYGYGYGYGRYEQDAETRQDDGPKRAA